MASGELGQQAVADWSDADPHQRMLFSRQCFHSVETFLETRAERPEGHPAIADVLADVDEALEAYFEHARSLPIRVRRDGLYDFQSERMLWDTAVASDVADSLRDHGIGLLGLRAGLSTEELHRLLALFDRCATGHVPFDPALDLVFDHVTLEWLDQSSVQLAGVGAGLPERDPTSVTRATHRLFEREFADRFEGDSHEGPTLLGFFNDRLAGAAHSPPDLPDDVDDGSARRDPMTRPADDVASVHVRRAEVFRAVLDDAEDASTRRRIADNVAAGLVRLLDNNRFDEAQACLTTLGDAGGGFADQLRSHLDSELDAHRQRRLAELLSIGESETRKAMLEFAHLLRSTTLTQLFASTAEWDLPESASGDLVHFLERRSEDEFRPMVDIIDKMTTERAGRLIDAAASGLPATRSFLQESLRLEIAPALKRRALDALDGSWGDRDRMLDYVRPLVGTPDAGLRGRAIDTIADGAPEVLEEILDPYVSESLSRRDDEDLAKIVRAYAEYGSARALRKLEDLIHIKRFSGDERCRLAVQIVEALADLDSEELRSMFGQVADDWLVPSPVRKACKAARTRKEP